MSEVPAGWEFCPDDLDELTLEAYRHRWGAVVERRADGWHWWAADDEVMHDAGSRDEAMRRAGPDGQGRWL